MNQANAELAALAVASAATGGFLVGRLWIGKTIIPKIAEYLLLVASLFLLFCACFTE